MVDFIKLVIEKQSLQQFYDLSKHDIVTQIEEIAKRLISVPGKFKLSTEVATDLAYLALYDLCILIDDSGSMSFYKSDKRIESLRNALKSILAIYGAIVPGDRRITIRYVNEADHDHQTKSKLPKELIPVSDEPRVELDALVMPEVEARVNALVDKIPFNGLSRIGHALQSYLLEDLVYINTRPAALGKLRNIGKMKRPLQIMVITDGEIEGEDERELPQAIEKVLKAARRNKHIACKRAVVFQFSRVGSNKNAMDYLSDLDRRKHIGDFIGAHANDVSAAMNLRNAKTVQEQKLMMKLLLGAVRTEYDRMNEKDEDNQKDENKVYEDENEEQMDDNDEWDTDEED